MFTHLTQKHWNYQCKTLQYMQMWKLQLWSIQFASSESVLLQPSANNSVRLTGPVWSIAALQPKWPMLLPNLKIAHLNKKCCKECKVTCEVSTWIVTTVYHYIYEHTCTLYPKTLNVYYSTVYNPCYLPNLPSLLWVNLVVVFLPPELPNSLQHHRQPWWNSKVPHPTVPVDFAPPSRSSCDHFGRLDLWIPSAVDFSVPNIVEKTSPNQYPNLPRPW